MFREYSRLMESNQTQGAALAQEGGALNEVELTQARVEMILDVMFGPMPKADASNLGEVTLQRLQFELNWARSIDKTLTGAFELLAQMKEEHMKMLRQEALKSGRPVPGSGPIILGK